LGLNDILSNVGFDAGYVEFASIKM